MPGKGCQQIALLRQLLLKRWQQFFSLRQCRILREHICLRRLTEVELTLEDIEKATLNADNASRRRDLAAKRRLLNRGRHDVAREGEIGSLQLKQLLFRYGVKVFDCPEVAAPDVRREAHCKLIGHERVLGLRSRSLE